MISNLLFDLGGVILDIKRSRCVDAFRRMGMADPEQYLGDYAQAGFFSDLEAGLISPHDFRAEVRKLIPTPVTDEQIDQAFNEFLVGIPVERLHALERLSADYRIYMLSNTNAIMWHSRIADEFRKDGHDINYYFDGIVTSFEAKVCKPDRRIFEYAAHHLGINPSETLFLDDSEANCVAARSCGYHSQQVTTDCGFETIIRQVLPPAE